MIYLSETHFKLKFYIDGLVQERCNSSVLALELRLSCTNPMIQSCLPITYFSVAKSMA